VQRHFAEGAARCNRIHTFPLSRGQLRQKYPFCERCCYPSLILPFVAYAPPSLPSAARVSFHVRARLASAFMAVAAAAAASNCRGGQHISCRPLPRDAANLPRARGRKGSVSLVDGIGSSRKRVSIQQSKIFCVNIE
jgi:hypothetical protein